jgi:hypothetical protein
MPEPLRATQSDLSHHPAKVLDGVNERDVLISRRDDEDVLVSTVSRHQALRSVANLVAAMERTQSQTGEAMKHAYPWLASLPSEDQKNFAGLYAKVVAACAAHDDFQPLAVFLNQWRYTASVHGNEMLLAALTGTVVEDEVSGRKVSGRPLRTTVRTAARRPRRVATA